MPDLSLRKSYMVLILGKYISLLQFTKCIMLKSLLKYVSKGIEIVLRHYVFYKTLNFIHIIVLGLFIQEMLLVTYKQTLF